MKIIMTNFSSLQLASSTTISILLFIVIIAFYILGHFFIKRAIRKDPDHINIELGLINGACSLINMDGPKMF